MSDEALRELERVWRQERTLVSEVRYLRESLRVGALDQDRMGLAAYLLHEPAIEVVGRTVTVNPIHKPKALHVWARELSRFGLEGFARLWLAEGRRLMGVLNRAMRAGKLSRAGGELRFAAALEDELAAWLLGGRNPEQLRAATWRARGEGTVSPFVGTRWGGHVERMHQALDCAAAALLGEAVAAPVLGWGIPAEQLLPALRAELVPWCTGDYDPVQRRTEGVLERLQIAAPCQAAWEEMRGDDEVRHCLECDRNVYNLSALSRTEAEALVAKQGEVCVRFYQRTDGTVLTRDCPVGLRRLAQAERARRDPFEGPEVMMGSVAPNFTPGDNPFSGPNPFAPSDDA